MAEFYYAEVDNDDKILEYGSLGPNLEDIDKLTEKEDVINVPIDEEMAKILEFCDKDIEKLSKPINHFFKTVGTMRDAKTRSKFFEPIFKDLTDMHHDIARLSLTVAELELDKKKRDDALAEGKDVTK
jgi:hypothetical protein